MSAKGQAGSVSDEHDFYPTDERLADWIVEHLVPAWTLRHLWFEPSAGSCTLVDALLRGGVSPAMMQANEPFQEIDSVHRLSATWTHKRLMQLDPEHLAGGRPQHSLNNHPFSLWEEHTRHVHYLVQDSGLIIQVGRASVLYPQKRAAFRRKYTPMLKVSLEERVSFTGDGNTDSADYAVWIYRKGHRPPDGVWPEIVASWKNRPTRDVDTIRRVMARLGLDRPH